LFADIKGSMELIEDLDPEEARAIVDPALKLMIDAVHRYDGYVVQSTGDGVFALFGAPIAHEDHPQRALYAALRMQEEIRRYGDRMRTHGQTPLQVRIGVNSGEVVVRGIQTGADHNEYTPIGHSTSLAARLQSLAVPGTTVISSYTAGFVEGYFLLKTLGPTRMKGVSDPVEVFEVTGLGPLRTRLQRAAGRGLTKFVGRQREIDAMRHAAELAKQGHGQLVAAIADPGVGKSRLFHEFKAIARSGWTILDTFSVSHGKASAYLPVIELLHNYFDISAEDDERKRGEKVAGKIVMLDRALEDTIPYLFSLLDVVEGDDPLGQMNGHIKRRRTIEAIKRILVRESLNRPVMVIFEDLHWIDTESQALINLLVDSIATAKLLLLVNYRPEYRHEWSSRSYYTQLRLDPLGTESAEEMLNSLLGDDRSLGALRHLIIEKTEGNPFFIEEIVQSLFEEGVLARNGLVKLTRPLSAIRIPATVQAMLAARIDRLPPEEKELLHTIALIGKDFGLKLVRSVWEHPHPRAVGESQSEIEEMLSNLQLAEFIYEQPATGDTEYTFKHALAHEVAYNSILLERRKQIHERAGLALETLHSHDRTDFVGELAHHYSRSGNVQKAVEYLTLAGEQAAFRSALAEAAGYTMNALERLPRLPEGGERDRTELRLQLAGAAAQAAIAGWSSPERFRSLERARELCDRIGDAGEVFPILWQLCQTYMGAGRYAQAAELANRSLQIAAQEGDRVKLMLAHYNLCEFNFRTGNFVSSRYHTEQAIELFESDRDANLVQYYGVDVGVLIFGFSAWNRCIAGFLDQGLKDAESTVRYAHSRNHSYSLALALQFLCLVRYWRREPELLRQTTTETIAQCAEHAFPEVDAMVRGTHGWASAAMGRSQEGIADAIDAVKHMQSLGIPYPSYAITELSDTYLVADHLAQALDTADEGLRMVAHTGEHGSDFPLLYCRAEALSRIDRVDEAVDTLSTAINVARKQGSKLGELWTTKSLARLLAVRGRGQEAHTMLATVYGWFTEGFDTPGLREAKALLEQLGS
jgi:class 3 adenylate cyclase/tetratricopeptide (TPR) repeat protein